MHWRRVGRWALSFAAVTTSGRTAFAQQYEPPPPPCVNTRLGEEGETCRSRADCRGGLRCIDAVCVSHVEGEGCVEQDDCGIGTHLACVAGRCEMAQEPSKLAGVHPFVGLGAHGGAALFADTGSQGIVLGSVVGSFAGVVRGGVFLGRNELALEVAPYTYAWNLSVLNTPIFNPTAFEFVATYARFRVVAEGPNAQVYWPVRIGVGAIAGGNNTADDVFFEGRFDFLGPAVRIGHVMLDFQAPSIRYFVTNGVGFVGSKRINLRPSSGATYMVWNLMAGATASYMFF